MILFLPDGVTMPLFRDAAEVAGYIIALNNEQRPNPARD